MFSPNYGVNIFLQKYLKITTIGMLNLIEGSEVLLSINHHFSGEYSPEI